MIMNRLKIRITQQRLAEVSHSDFQRKIANGLRDACCKYPFMARCTRRVAKVRNSPTVLVKIFHIEFQQYLGTGNMEDSVYDNT
jgi:hypothetical protein